MREIGGYIEFEHYHGDILHTKAKALNSGRNCLAYLFKSREIKKLMIPYFICNSVINICDRENVVKRFYHIDVDFRPTVDLKLEADEWLYLVNFYGQLTAEDIRGYIKRYKRVIVDQANAYFEMPLCGVDTIYTCRKWFGVSDGAFLYTDSYLDEKFEIDESFDRMRFLLGRLERTANEFYSEYNANNQFFIDEPIKRMSKLTANLLRGIDYETVEKQRISNFEYLHGKLKQKNKLNLKTASFMYPFMIENGDLLRKRLQKEKIYIPTLWPAVFDIADKDSVEYSMARNILPLPIDQRYGFEDMEYMVGRIKALMEV